MNVDESTKEKSKIKKAQHIYSLVDYPKVTSSDTTVTKWQIRKHEEQGETMTDHDYVGTKN